MDSKTAAAPPSADYEPNFEWIKDQENHVLHVKLLPGFTKEDLKVQIDTMGTVRVSGEHKVDRQKPIAFRKSFRLPENSKRNEITARFQDGVLKVFIPVKEPPKEQPPASEGKTAAAGGTATANKQSEDESEAARNAKPSAASGGEGGTPSNKSDSPRDMRTSEESRKQSQDETGAGGNAASPGASGGEAPGASGGEDGRPADKPVKRAALGSQYESWTGSKYMNRLSVGLKTRRKQVVSVGIGILVLAVVLGFYAAYRLGESVEDGN